MGASLSLTAATTAGQNATGVTGASQTGAEPKPATAPAAPPAITPVPDDEAEPEPQPDTPMLQPSSAPSVEKTKVWPQCGLEDDDWPRYEGPQRIKTCQLSENKKFIFKAHLTRLFSPDTVMGVKLIFTPDEILEVLNAVIEYLKSEPMLIEDVPFDCQIVGDIHGQFYDLDRVLTGDDDNYKPGWERGCRYVFLGDYVDRGRQSTEVVMALFILKMLYPDQFFLLRGNHEFFNINLTYGFYMELVERYGRNISQTLMITFNECFSNLSIAAIVGNIYFCSHAGVSPTGFTRRQLRALVKPYFTSTEDIVIHDICWSDPAQGLQGTVFNKDRSGSIYYGFDALAHALKSMQVLACFRGHSRMKHGMDCQWSCCFTVFTATDYGGTGNEGAVAVVEKDGKVWFRILDVDPVRASFERRLHKLEYITEDANEELTVADPEIGSGEVVKL